MNEEMKKYLESHLEEEMKDACGYMEKAKELDNAGMFDMASGFAEMAKDEYTHTRFIIGQIMKSGGSLSKEHKEKWEELDEKIRSFLY